jgi:hypothetical protein
VLSLLVAACGAKSVRVEMLNPQCAGDASIHAGVDGGGDAASATARDAAEPCAKQRLYPDADHDGYGVTAAARQSCPAAGLVTLGGDCNDHDPTIRPGAIEVCDGLDNNCNGAVDDGVSCNCLNGAVLACGEPDGHGGFVTLGVCRTGMQTCTSGRFGACAGVVLPAVETCNALDDDCDGVVDEGVTALCWADADSDGYAASAASSAVACGSCPAQTTALAPSGQNIDCNDSLVSVHPGASELCNAVDDNCNGVVDEGFGLGIACGAGACAGGVIVCATDSTTRCSTGSTEVCDGVDNDCNGVVDDGTAISTCAAAGHTCYQGACAGCAAATHQCSNSTVSQKCDGTGGWNNDAMCMPHAPTNPTICDSRSASSTYGTCIANPPYDIGNDSGSGRVAYGAFANLVLAQPFVTDADVQLLGLGLVTTSANVGGTAYIGLYADSIDSSSGQHEPGAIINRTPQLFLAAASNNLTKPAFTSATNVDLTANTRYWIVTNLYQSSSESIVIYTSSTSDSAGDARSGTRAFAALSTLASGATMKVTGDVALFIQAQRN